MVCNTKPKRNVDPDVGKARGEVAGYSRTDNVEALEAARKRLADAKITARIRALIAEAPTFTPEQISILRGAFGGAR